MSPIDVRAGQDPGTNQPTSNANMPSVNDSQPAKQAEPESRSPTESLVQSQKAFYRDLPQLLRQYPGQWVAYYRSFCVKVGKKQELVYQYCLDQSFDEEDFIVLYVEPMNGLTLSSICH